MAGAAGMAAGAELDLERLLWVPKPIVTVPAMPGGLNAFITSEIFAHEALRILSRTLTYMNHPCRAPEWLVTEMRMEQAGPVFEQHVVMGAH
jgi:hypothetical protein